MNDSLRFASIRYGSTNWDVQVEFMAGRIRKEFRLLGSTCSPREKERKKERIFLFFLSTYLSLMSIDKFVQVQVQVRIAIDRDGEWEMVSERKKRGKSVGAPNTT